jgi:predicted amidophosphoribosyltransferase
MAASGSLGGNGRNKQKDELEEIIASRKRSRQESSAGFCPHCGRPVSKSDKFCSRCGTAL